VGSKKNPVWRVVVADQRSPRDGRIIESIGHYNARTEPSTIVIDRERLQHWIDRGAVPTNTVRKLMRAPDSATRANQPEAEAPAEPAVDLGEAPAESAVDLGEAPASDDIGPLPDATEAEDAQALPQEGEATPAGTAAAESEAGEDGAES